MWKWSVVRASDAAWVLRPQDRDISYGRAKTRATTSFSDATS